MYSSPHRPLWFYSPWYRMFSTHTGTHTRLLVFTTRQANRGGQTHGLFAHVVTGHVLPTCVACSGPVSPQPLLRKAVPGVSVVPSAAPKEAPPPPFWTRLRCRLGSRPAAQSPPFARPVSQTHLVILCFGASAPIACGLEKPFLSSSAQYTTLKK